MIANITTPDTVWEAKRPVIIMGYALGAVPPGTFRMVAGSPPKSNAGRTGPAKGSAASPPLFRAASNDRKYSQTKGAGQIRFNDDRVLPIVSLAFHGWPAGIVAAEDLSREEFSYGKTVQDSLTEHVDELARVKLVGFQRIQFHGLSRAEQTEINRVANRLMAGCEQPSPSPGYPKGCSIRKVSLFFEGKAALEGIFVYFGANHSPAVALGPENQEYELYRYDIAELIFNK